MPGAIPAAGGGNNEMRMNLFSLENQVAVITGASSGIGAETAALFAAAGADVVLGHYGPDGYDISAVVGQVEAAGSE